MSGDESQPPRRESEAGTADQDPARDFVRLPFAKKLLSFYRQKQVVYLGGLLMLAVTLVFLPSLRNDFVNYDDPEYVTDNPHVQSGLTLEGSRWVFVTTDASY